MFKTALIKEIAVQVTDRVGALAEILTPIAEASLNLKGIYTLSLANEAQIRLIAEDTDQVVGVLKSSGYVPRVEEIVAVEVPNESGAIAQVATRLASTEIDLRASWASIGNGAKTTLYLWTADNAATVKCLTA